MTGEAAPALPKPPRGGSRQKWPILGAQILLGLLLVAAVGRGLWAAAQEGKPQPFPGEIAGLHLVRGVTGEEALAEVRQLHGKEVGLVSGWVAQYQGRATVWVGQAESEAQAAQLLQAMTQRIGVGNPVFSGLERREVEGQEVFSVVGQGQRHYYYQRGRLVIWLAAPPGKEKEFLADALRLIR